MIESSQVLKEIKDLLKDGKSDKAFDLIQTTILTKENRDSYYWCLSMYNIIKGNTENNIEYFEKNIILLQEYLKDTINYANEDLWHNLLTSYLNKYDFEELFTDCKFVILNLPNSDMAFNLMAQGFNNKNEFSEALFNIDKAIEINRGKYAYYVIKYNILIGLNKKQEAYTEFLKSIVIAKGGKFESRLHRFITTLGMNFIQPFLFNGMCQLNNLTCNSINPEILENYSKYENYKKYFHFLNLTTDKNFRIKNLCHYLGNDISVIHSNLNLDNLIAKKHTIFEVFIYFESALSVLGFAIPKQVEYLQKQIDSWLPLIDSFKIEELYLISTLLTQNLKPVYSSPFFLKILSSKNYISSIFNLSNQEDINNFIKNEIQNLNLQSFGSNAESDLNVLEKFLVLKHIYSLTEQTHYNQIDFDIFNSFSFSNETNLLITQKIREIEIQAILKSFTEEFSSKMVYNNGITIEQEINELKDIFITRKEVLKSTYLSLKKYDVKIEEVTFEKAFALKIEKFEFSNPKPYLLLLKLFYLENKLTIEELVYLHFFTLTICEIKGKGIKQFQETIIKGKEEVLKSTIKLFGNMFMTTIGFVSKIGDIAIAGFAASIGKLYESFLKQQTEDDLLSEVAFYDSFKGKFLIHISFLFESYGEQKFKEIYLIDYSMIKQK